VTASNDRQLAERAIAEQLQRYCSAVDAYDAEGFAKLWTADAQVDFGERYRGEPEGFMASVIEARSRTPTMTHQLQEISIEVSNDLASATSSSVVSAAVTRTANTVA
jgi:ketosteroid isomerase-like protein